jgi:hypothetical protein
MRDIPLIFPASLVVILLMLVFASAYAISDTATSESEINGSAYDWKDKTALIVCPFH